MFSLRFYNLDCSTVRLFNDFIVMQELVFIIAGLCLDTTINCVGSFVCLFVGLIDWIDLIVLFNCFRLFSMFRSSLFTMTESTRTRRILTRYQMLLEDTPSSYVKPICQTLVSFIYAVIDPTLQVAGITPATPGHGERSFSYMRVLLPGTLYDAGYILIVGFKH